MTGGFHGPGTKDFKRRRPFSQRVRDTCAYERARAVVFVGFIYLFIFMHNISLITNF